MICPRNKIYTTYTGPTTFHTHNASVSIHKLWGQNLKIILPYLFRVYVMKNDIKVVGHRICVPQLSMSPQRKDFIIHFGPQLGSRKNTHKHTHIHTNTDIHIANTYSQ